MATTGKINTTLLAIYTGTAPGTKITHQNDCTLTIGHAVRDVTTKDSAGWGESLEGLRTWEMSASGLLAWDAANAPDDFFTTNIVTRAVVTVIFTTNVSTDIMYSGTGWITSIEQSSPGQEETATWSISIQGTAAITKGAVT